MSHCHYYVSSTLYIIAERKSSSEMIRLLSLFSELPTLSSPDLWFLKAQSFWGAKIHEYLSPGHLCKVRTPSQRMKNRFFKVCFRFHLQVVFFFSLQVRFIPFAVEPSPIPLLCVPHQEICIEIIPGWGMFTGCSTVTWMGRHDRERDTTAQLLYTQFLFNWHFRCFVSIILRLFYVMLF